MIPFSTDMHQLYEFYGVMPEAPKPVAPSTAHAPLPAFRSPDMQAQSHQVKPGFGSAWLVR